MILMAAAITDADTRRVFPPPAYNRLFSWFGGYQSDWSGNRRSHPDLGLGDFPESSDDRLVLADNQRWGPPREFLDPLCSDEDQRKAVIDVLETILNGDSCHSPLRYRVRPALSQYLTD